MPLEIVRRDIVGMDCDAIVNPSNVCLEPGGGVDLAIHTAAGPELLEYCRKLGGCEVGKAKLSPGFALPSKYVIHTVGPVWDGGPISTLRLSDCYTQCLELAVSHDCRSIAFPLISAGTHGFPKDQVMQIALKAIGDFLLKHELMVYLVIYEKESYSLERRLSSRVRDYIEHRYRTESCLLSAYCPEEKASLAEYSIQSNATGRKRTTRRTASAPSPALYSAPVAPCAAKCEVASEQLSPRAKAPSRSLEDYIKLDKKFAYKLADLIAEKGMTSVECYKKANVSKQTWYKIETDPNYKPNKKTVLSFSIALKLTLPQTQSLLSSVGFVLSNSSLFDVILMYCIENKIYNVHEIDAILFQYDQETLFSKSA